MSDKEPSKNPFVRWKNHVDTRISTTLQGIVGLPSAISRNLNPLWPEVEEARRKEQKKERRDQPDRQQKDQPPEEPLPAVVSQVGKAMPEKSGHTTEPAADFKLAFFAPTRHGNRCPRAGADPSRPNPGGPNPGDPSHGDLNPGDPSDPNTWTAWPDWVQQARWHSFAAYSGYSPLNLRLMTQPRPSDLPAGKSSTFTFQDAFEDLLAVSSGKPLVSLEEKAETCRVLNSMFPTGEPAFYWIRRLQSQGLLNAYFPRADQIRRQFELESGSRGEEAQKKQRELDEKRFRMWKWVWSRHHEMRNEDKNQSDEKLDSEDWVKEIDSILSHAAKEVREGLSNGHIFGEIDRIFQTIEKAGDVFSGLSNAEAEHEKNKNNERREKENEKDVESHEETDEGMSTAFAKASRSEEPEASPFGAWDNMMNEHSSRRQQAAKHGNNHARNPAAGPYHETRTEESHDPQTGMRTVKTIDEKVGKNGNRKTRTEVRQFNADGNQISLQTSYSTNMSSSWSWSFGCDDGQKEEAPRRKASSASVSASASTSSASASSASSASSSPEGSGGGWFWSRRN